MPSFIFPTAGEELLQGNLNWLTDDIRAVLLQDGVTIDRDTMVYLDDVPEAWRITTSTTLTGRAVTGGKALSYAAYFEDFVDIEARQIGSILIVRHDAVPADTLLIAYYEGTNGFPFYGAGRNYYVAPLGGAWFQP